MKFEKILALAMLGALNAYEIAEKKHKIENSEESHKEVTEAWKIVQELKEVEKVLS